MEREGDKPKFKVTGFINEFFKTTMKLRVRAFGLYHKCMVQCYKDPFNTEIRKCKANCEMSKK